MLKEGPACLLSSGWLEDPYAWELLKTREISVEGARR